MNKLKITLAIISTMMLGACASDTTKEEIIQLQENQTQMNQKAAQDLSNAKTFEDNANKLNAIADQLQVQANAANKQVKELTEAYAQFDNPDSDDAVSIRERKTQATQKAIDLQEQINKYKAQAAEATKQAKDMKEAANTDATQSDEISVKITTLESTQK